MTPVPDGDAPREIGGYEVLAQLAAGGMGEVYLGRRRGAHGFEKLVAIKVMLGQHAKNPDARQAFLDEAKLLARLQHPAIAQVSDFGETAGYLYLVMEHVAGISVAALLTKQLRPLPPRVAADLFAQVCRGLSSAHELTDLDGRPLGVVHRDISPQNILVGFFGAAKLIDFGIAFALDRDQPVTEYGTIKGKPAYMAPEQWKSERIDQRVDIFATGVVLHEALTLQRLFRGDSPYATGMNVCSKPVPAPSSLLDGIPPALDAIALRALRRPADERYPTAAAMADDLERVARELPGKTLREHVEATLANERAAHRELLRRLTAGERVSGAPVGRPAGERTEVSGSGDEIDIEQWREATTQLGRALGALDASRASATLPPRPQPTTQPGPRQARAASSGDRRGRGRPVVLSLIGVLVIAGIAGYWAARSPTSNEPLAVPIDSAVVTAEAPSVDATSPVDAAPVDAAADAAPEADGTVDAQPARATRTKRRPPRAPRTKVTATPAPKGQARLTILAAPYANVRIDGKPLGATPKYRLKTMAGKHLLELIHPADGRVRFRVRLQLRPDEHRKILAPPLK